MRSTDGEDDLSQSLWDAIEAGSVGKALNLLEDGANLSFSKVIEFPCTKVMMLEMY